MIAKNVYHLRRLLSATFVDYAKALDKVETNATLSALNQRVYSAYMRQLAYCIQDDSSAVPHYDFHWKGVREGDIVLKSCSHQHCSG